MPTRTPFGHPSLTNPHTASAPPISTAGMLPCTPSRSCRSHRGTQMLSLARIQLLPHQQRLHTSATRSRWKPSSYVSLPLSLLTHLKAAAVFNLRTGLPKDLLLPSTITAMDGSRILRRTPPMGSYPSPSPRAIPTCRRSSPCTLSPLLLLLAPPTLYQAP